MTYGFFIKKIFFKIAQESELTAKIKKVNDEVAKYQETAKKLKENSSQSQSDLDSFMENLDDQTHQLDKTEIKKLRVSCKLFKLFHFYLKVLS